MPVEGRWVDRVVGLDGVRVEFDKERDSGREVVDNNADVVQPLKRHVFRRWLIRLIRRCRRTPRARSCRS